LLILNSANPPNVLFYLITFSTHLWVSLSSMYGKLMVVLMLAFCFTEVMDNSIAPLTFQVITIKLNNSIRIIWLIKNKIQEMVQ
jgi:hypothetical protein